MTNSSKSPRTLWHQLLGKVLEELLPPVGITVYVDFPVMSQPPQADIVLLRREQKYFGLESKIYLGSSKLKFGLRPKSLSGILF